MLSFWVHFKLFYHIVSYNQLMFSATDRLWVSEWVDYCWHISTIRPYSAIHVGSCWKIQNERQIKNTDNTKTKHNPEKANNAKHSKNKLPWFSRFLWHSARKQGGLILQCSQPHTGHMTHCNHCFTTQPYTTEWLMFCLSVCVWPWWVCVQVTEQRVSTDLVELRLLC